MNNAARATRLAQGQGKGSCRALVRNPRFTPEVRSIACGLTASALVRPDGDISSQESLETLANYMISSGSNHLAVAASRGGIIIRALGVGIGLEGGGEACVVATVCGASLAASVATAWRRGWRSGGEGVAAEGAVEGAGAAAAATERHNFRAK